MRRTALGSPALLLVMAACSSPGTTPATSEGATPSQAPPSSGGGDGIEHPGGDEPVLVVSFSGGMIPVQFQVTAMPTFVMLGNGRVFVSGAVPAIFPGPALPPILERTLTPDGIQSVLEAVEDTGLFTADVELRGAAGMVADASDTVFTLNAAGRQVTVTVYALGMVAPDMEPPPGMSSAEVEAHRVLAQLNEALAAIDTAVAAEDWEGEGFRPFEPEAFRLYVRDATGEPVDEGIGEDVRDWPTDDDPATAGEEVDFFGDGTRCAVVEGDAAASWFAELTEATQVTQWTTDGTNRFSVQARPLLPYEEAACPEENGAT
jgi:hypothetical protein